MIGGGAAGLAAAATAVRAGLRVSLVTEGPPGGDCTFTGCVPSKTLLDAAAADLSFDTALKRVRETVARVAATESEQVLRQQGIDVVRGRAHFVVPRTIEVGGSRLRARRVVIATGTRPAVPPILGVADVPYLTTDTVFDLDAMPGSLAVLGGGAVGCELAQAFARLGVEVTLIELADRLLPAIDPDASALLAEALTENGVRVHTGVPAHRVRGTRNSVAIDIGKGETIRSERLLVAAGRRPETGDLGLDVVDVRTDQNGFIIVDRHLRTGAAGISAAGDVTGLFPFTHGAYAMGRIAVQASLRRSNRPVFNPHAIPRVVFTDPEIAIVGAGEHKLDGVIAKVAYLSMSEVDRAITAAATRGFVKLIAGPRRPLGFAGGGRLLGATIVASRAGELIHEPALAMQLGMFTGRLAQTTHAYPSTAIQQAAAQFFGTYGGRTAYPAEYPRRVSGATAKFANRA
ncbi:dihydrolipoyl dehydrogenase family protein [Saccharopolyspora elongata]|uniref:NAD(P)/FAD-dependent oxidoreductase n=1 Tax=Saccharopolyspora elongata TaxID=2530387 RepID=A0A4R4ZFJ7_9PSEU|nr:NAD(P)/FAD-dependent oxidoreductase [Saccharopolyspora elongata]TDD55242.1 NAD(P)/FAD-dependent oxidoreductase [Saccharopolyspora elongata]